MKRCTLGMSPPHRSTGCRLLYSHACQLLQYPPKHRLIFISNLNLPGPSLNCHNTPYLLQSDITYNFQSNTTLPFYSPCLVEHCKIPFILFHILPYPSIHYTPLSLPYPSIHYTSCHTQHNIPVLCYYGELLTCDSAPVEAVHRLLGPATVAAAVTIRLLWRRFPKISLFVPQPCC